MSDSTKIEWADHTFSPWVGCTKVDMSCDHCYAENWAKRSGHPELWEGKRRRTTSVYWQQPIKWDRQAAAAGVRRRVFPSLCDPFDNKVPKRWRNDLWRCIDETPNLDWMLLTKRPQNIARMLPDPDTGVKPWGNGWPNVWFGVSAGDEVDAERNISILLATPAAIRFVSLEPLLEPVDLRQWLHLYQCGCGWGGDSPLDYCNKCGWRGEAPIVAGLTDDCVRNCPECKWPLSGDKACPECEGHDGDGISFGPNHLPKLNLVIAGGESGPRARSMHPDWPRRIRDDCARAGVAFFFKQWGEWAPVSVLDDDTIEGLYHPAPKRHPEATRICRVASHVLHTDSSVHDLVDPTAFAAGKGAMTMFRVGRGPAGCLLDGRTWKEMPGVTG
jgi:protein gp37